MPFSSSNAPYPANEPLPSGNAFSVLVVEDQGSVHAALVAELRRSGVSDIFEAPDGQAALHLFKTHRPALVLLDIKLPGQDGYWVAQQMRESEAGDWTPIIFLSCLDNELDVWCGIEVGGDDYLVKPVKPIVLMAKLRAMRRLPEGSGLPAARSLQAPPARGRALWRQGMRPHPAQHATLRRDDVCAHTGAVAQGARHCARGLPAGRHANPVRRHHQLGAR